MMGPAEGEMGQSGLGTGGPSGPVIERILSRHVIRDFEPREVEPQHLEALVRAAYAAPWGGGLHMDTYVIVTGDTNRRKIRAVSPGITGNPPALIALCLDHAKATEFGLGPSERTSLHLALGAAMQNLLLAAQDLGLGACPIGSFNRQALSILLDLPENLEPVLMVSVGNPTDAARTRPRPPEPDLSQVIHWERY